VRLFLTANGLLLPFIALQMYVHSLIWIASLWAVTFPGSTMSLGWLFRRSAITRDMDASATAENIVRLLHSLTSTRDKKGTGYENC
jgi:hypothetical protein